MVIEFFDEEAATVHDEFQAWRTANQSGVFLTLGSRARGNLHGARCVHLGSGPPYFSLSDGFGSLTAKRKVCGSEPDLLAWAERRGVAVRRCSHCVRDGFIGAPEAEDSGSAAVIPDSIDAGASRAVVNSTIEFTEGAVEYLLATRYERNLAARQACLDHFGTKCRGCGIKMEEVYGVVGVGYVHVHHRVPISSIGSEYVLDPVRDLVPVCPNCHAMIHTSNPPLEVERLAGLVQEQRLSNREHPLQVSGDIVNTSPSGTKP